MAAITAGTLFPGQLGTGVFPNEDSLPVAAGAVIPKGGVVGIRGGYAVTANPAAAGEPDLFCVGIANGTGSRGIGPIPTVESDVDNTAGAAGDKFVKVVRGIFLFKNTATAAEAVVATDIGKPVYLLDNVTVTRNSNNGKRPVLGRIWGLTTSYESGGAVGVWVQVGIFSAERILAVRLSGADLSGHQYGLVKMDNTGRLVKGAAADDAIFGVVQNVPAAAVGSLVEVCTFGPTFGKVGAGNISASGVELACDANGLLTDAAAAHRVQGIAEEAGVSTNVKMFYFRPSGYKT